MIGRQAQIVRDMEAQSGAKIIMAREATRISVPGRDSFRFLTAEGKKKEVNDAYALVMKYIGEARSKAQSDSSNPTLLRVPLSVPAQLLDVIIGKGGATLKKIQEDFDVKVIIEHNEEGQTAHKGAGKQHRLLEVVGEPNRVEACQRNIVERLIEAVQTGDPRSMMRRGRSRARREPTERPVSVTIPSMDSSSNVSKAEMTVSVPIVHVGAVIGARGSKVRHIVDETGARIHIEGKEKLAPDAVDRAMLITGTDRQVLNALSMIHQSLNDESDPTRLSAQRVSSPALVRILDSNFPFSPSSVPYAVVESSVPRSMILGSNVPPPAAYGGHPPLHSQYVGGFEAPPQYQPSMPPPVTANAGGGPLLMFDPDKLSMLASQISKNVTPVGSGNITQIIGSPNPPVGNTKPKDTTTPVEYEPE